MQMTVAQALARGMKAYGAEYVFTLTGAPQDPLIQMQNREGIRVVYLAAMRWRYQRRSVAGVATDAIWASASRPKAWGLDREPAPVVVREPETLAPKPGSERAHFPRSCFVVEKNLRMQYRSEPSPWTALVPEVS